MKEKKAREIAKRIKRVVMANMKKHKGGVDYAEIQEMIIKILCKEV